MNQCRLHIFDSHAHYDDSSFDDDRDQLINEMHHNGIVGIMNCGASLEGALTSVNLSKQYDFIYSAVGIHPENAYEYNSEVEEQFRSIVKSESKVKAIGEIGLDYHFEENPPREIQKEIFIKQMHLAEELNLPVIIHDRDAHKDTLDIMKEFPEVKGTVHCFSGSVEFAKECIKLGYYIGITGVVTFKNAKKIHDVIREIPLERLLVETDCPYMAPVPFRGKRNKSDYIEYIIEQIALIKEIDPKEVNIAVNNNFNNLICKKK